MTSWATTSKPLTPSATASRPDQTSWTQKQGRYCVAAERAPGPMPLAFQGYCRRDPGDFSLGRGGNWVVG